MSRLTSIGASDAAAAIGANPWKSPFTLWAEKTGQAPEPDLSEKEAVQWGNILEPIIAATYSERTGRKVVHNESQVPTRHPDLPFLTATLDAIQVDEAKPWGQAIGSLEIKTAGYHAGKAWDEEPPLMYQVQLQHQLAVTGMNWGTLCALIGGNKLRWFDQDRNERFIHWMIEQESLFWAHVIDRVPPEPDGSIATTDCLKLLYPHATLRKIVDLPREAVSVDEELQVIKIDLKHQTKERQRLENKMRAWIGDASAGVLPNGVRYTWNQQTAHHEAKGAYDSTYRVLRRKKG